MNALLEEESERIAIEDDIEDEVDRDPSSSIPLRVPTLHTRPRGARTRGTAGASISRGR